MEPDPDFHMVYGSHSLSDPSDFSLLHKDFFRRLQIQERMTHQISQTIMETINAEGVGVVCEAQHLCMRMRGVEKQNSIMTTSSMLGSFRKEASTRQEFLRLIKG